MIIVRPLQANRKWLSLGLLGLLPLLGGCGDNKSDKPAAPDPAKQEQERSAREKAYGPGGASAVKPGAPKPAEKPAAK